MIKVKLLVILSAHSTQHNAHFSFLLGTSLNLWNWMIDKLELITRTHNWTVRVLIHEARKVYSKQTSLGPKAYQTRVLACKQHVFGKKREVSSYETSIFNSWFIKPASWINYQFWPYAIQNWIFLLQCAYSFYFLAIWLNIFSKLFAIYVESQSQ